jgi:preprotein translocase subunit SecA
MLNPFAKIFGSSNDRVIKKMMRHVNDANNLEKDLSAKSDEYFLNLKSELKELYDNNDKNIYSILPIAFAAVREASKRTIGLRHFDSQMLGGITLAEGNIAEMKTGEGKT